MAVGTTVGSLLVPGSGGKRLGWSVGAEVGTNDGDAEGA